MPTLEASIHDWKLVFNILIISVLVFLSDRCFVLLLGMFGLLCETSPIKQDCICSGSFLLLLQAFIQNSIGWKDGIRYAEFLWHPLP